MSTPNQSLSLPLTDTTDADIAARFVAELVRQGVTFKARRDFDSHPSGVTTEQVLAIQFTGGF